MRNRRRSSLRLSLLVALGVLGGCTANQAPPSSASAKAVPSEVERIEYAISPCRGFCPAYAFAISADGNAHFAGVRQTKFDGARPVDADPSRFRAIVAALEPARPSGARQVSSDGCRNYVTDQQQVTVTWMRGGDAVSTLEFDLGCLDEAEQPVRRSLSAARKLMPINDLVGRATDF